MNQSDNLQGQIALVTGSSRGIGRAIARRLAGAGAEVIVHFRANATAAREAAAEIGSSRVVQADLASTEDIKSLAAELGDTRLDILVNNAGVWKPTPLGSTSLEVAEEILHTNVLGVFWLTQALLPILRDGARIVNVSSVAGRTASGEGRSVYRASKAAIDSFTRNWALELAPRGIRVNAVAPGVVETDLTRDYLADPQARKRWTDRHPFGKLGNPGQVADAVHFLCSKQASSVTGQSLNVSSGFVI